MDPGPNSNRESRLKQRYRRAWKSIKELNRLLRQDRRMKKPPKVSRPDRITALLVLGISGSLFWAICYLLLHPPFVAYPELFPWSEISIAFLLSWLDDPAVLAAVTIGMNNLNDYHRFAAARFLRQSVIVQMLAEQNRKGLAVPAATIVLFYIQACGHTDAGLLAEIECRSLQEDTRNFRRKWLEQFRAKWEILHGPLRALKEHEEEESITKRVLQNVSTQPRTKKRCIMQFL